MGSESSAGNEGRGAYKKGPDTINSKTFHQ
jgi:hypothetical protein